MSLRRLWAAGLVPALLLATSGPPVVAAASAGLRPSARPTGRTADPCVPGIVDDRCEQWVARYTKIQSTAPQTFGSKVEARASAVSPDGAVVYTTGRAFVYASATGASVSAAEIFTAAYEAGTGAEIWSSTYRYAGQVCPNFFWDTPQSIAAAPDGSRVFVTGRSCDDAGEMDFVTLAYDAKTGGQAWVARHEYATDVVTSDHANGLSISPDGERVYVAGDTKFPDSNYRREVLVAYDTGNGEELWSVHAPDPKNAPAAVAGIAVASGPALEEEAACPDGLDPDCDWVYVLSRGASVPLPANENLAGTVPEESVVTAYRGRTGEVVWRSFSSGRMARIARAMELSRDGRRIFVTAWDADRFGSTEANYSTYALDASTGAQAWRTDYSSPGVGSRDEPYDLTVGPGGLVYVTGFELNSGGQYIANTVAFDGESGAQLWAVKDSPLLGGLPSAGYIASLGFDVATNPATGVVYVAGVSRLGDKFVHRVVAHEPATGARRWVATFDEELGNTNGPGSWFAEQQRAMPRGLQVSPTGDRVFSVGLSLGLEDFRGPDDVRRSWNGVTLAYSA